MRILIVEDEVRIAADLAEAVNAGGYVAEVVTDGEDAWFRGGTENYAAIILDLGLPKIDGITVLKRWRQEGLTTPVLVLTARGTWTDRVDGIDAGADDYLPKPFRMEELMARLRALVRRSAGRAKPSIEVAAVVPDQGKRRAVREDQPEDQGMHVLLGSTCHGQHVVERHREVGDEDLQESLGKGLLLGADGGESAIILQGKHPAE